MSTAVMPTPAAVKPFYFNTSAHLMRIERERANTLNELLAALRTCSDASIFQHTIRTLEEHHFIREGFSNDFAHWVFAACNEPGLAEQLANINIIREFTSAEALRARLVQLVETYVALNPRAAERTARECFYFCSSEMVVLPTNFHATNLEEFRNGLEHVTVHSIHHHFIEARLRLKLVSNDFSEWLRVEMQLPEAASRINGIDVYTVTLEDARWQMIEIVKQAQTRSA